MSRITFLLSCVVIVLLSGDRATGQTVVDPNLRVNTWVSAGLNDPVGAAIFNSRGDMMVIEKNTGQVKVVRQRRVRQTLLDLPVSNDSERGLLGIALSPNFGNDGHVYLFHTVADADGGDAIANRISRYTYDGSRLVFNKRLIDLPGNPGPNHDGGKITFGPDGKLYAVIGDLNLNNQMNNFTGLGRLIQNTSAVLRLNRDGSIPSGNPFAGEASAIYAYGIRNSFGIAFDPVTGDLWDTENGPQQFDEINRVFKGFNSGWEDIMGPVSRNGGQQPGGLASLGPAATYADPKFTWVQPVAPTDLEFLPNARLGASYKNDLFVGTTREGKILRFDLTSTRKSLRLTGALADGVADNTSGLFNEQDDLIFGEGFGIVADLFAGPGGMYVVSLTNNAIYRITTVAPPMGRPSSVPEPSMLAIPVAALLLARRAAPGR